VISVAIKQTFLSWIQPPNTYVVHEDRAEVADDVNDAEDEASGAEHGEVGPLEVSMDGAARLVRVRERRGAAPGGAGHHREVVVHHLGASEAPAGGVHEEHEDDEDDVHDDGVDVAGEEGGLEPSGERVDDDAERDEEAGRVHVDTRERVCHSRAAQQQHGGDNHVGGEAEHQEHDVRGAAPPGAHDLAHRVRVGRLALDLDGHDAEQEHLDGGAAGVPERPAHAVLPRHVRALQDRRRPCPLLDSTHGDPLAYQPFVRD
jgi:hypothetical protein